MDRRMFRLAVRDRLPQTEAAMAYAERLHHGQRRRVDGAPFILHPVEVASLLYYAGAPDHLIAAGALHDVIEKTPVAASELRNQFGERIADLVEAVSEDPQIRGYTHRKAALREQVANAGEEALMLFAADKLAKVRELRVEALGSRRSRARSITPPPKQARQLAHYLGCLSLLEEALPDSPLVRALRRELGMLSSTSRRQPLLAEAF